METFDNKKAEKNIRNGWIAGSISGGLTLIASLIGAFNEQFQAQFGADEWMLIDVFIIAVLTYGIYQKNRFAALIMLIYFVISKIYIFMETQRPNGLFIGIIFTIIYVKATQAAFELHKHRKAADIQEYPKAKKRNPIFYVGVSIASVIGLGIVILFSLGVLGLNSPSFEVIKGNELDEEQLSFVQQKGLLEPDEQIDYWYSHGLFDFKDGFVFFTAQKVVIYNSEWDTPAEHIRFEHIKEIEIKEDSTDVLSDPTIYLYLYDNTYFYFPVSNENDKDQEFYNRMREVWSNNLEDVENSLFESLVGEE